MARAIRWTIPFVSLNGTSCHVDIYDEGWMGSVTTLKGGETPFYYEENNDKDVLRTIRPKTGYISIVEEVTGALDDIYAERLMSRYVRVYYGNTVCFTGYIQTRTYDESWSGGVAVRRFAVSSPLGLIEDVFFPTYSTPIEKTAAGIFDIIAEQLGVSYDNVFAPVTEPALTAVTLSTMAICGINDEHSYKVYNDEPVWKVQPLSFFLDNLCKMLGWTVRDVGESMLFTCPTYAGTTYYNYVKTANGRQAVSVPISGAAVRDLSSTFAVADNRARISTLSPYRRVKYTFTDDKNFTSSWLPRSGHYSYDQSTRVFTYTPFAARTSAGTLRPVADNDKTLNIVNGRTGFTLTICNYYEFVSGVMDLELLDTELGVDVPIQIAVTDRAQMDSAPKKYLVISPGLTPYWSDNGQQPTTCYISKETNKLAYMGTGGELIEWRMPMLSKWDIGDVVQIEITFPNLTTVPYGLPPGDVQLNFNIEYFSRFYTDMFYDDIQLTAYNLAPEGEVVEITPDLRNGRSADGLFLMMQGLVPPSPNMLANVQKRLVCNFKTNRVMDNADYINLIKITASSLRWRIMAEKFTLRDDNHELTLHHGDCLDSI